MSIKHFEDLPLLELIDVITNISDYEATEKLDGAQLLFGIDDQGFYTSRGTTRVYNVAEYEIGFSTTYQRFAHVALKESLSKLLAAGMKSGDQVEIEVLHGELPNVVPYLGDISHIVFLRTTAGSVDIDRLGLEFSGHSLTVTLQSPFTNDGINIRLETNTQKWGFGRVPVVEIDEIKLEAYIDLERERLVSRLAEQSNQPGKTVYELATLNLSKLPVADRAQAKIRRESIREILQRKYILPLKAILLNNIVRGKGSKYGPLGGWIEGVVLKHKTTGKMVKLVDKDTFGVIHKFVWEVRNSLDKVSSRETILSLLDKYKKEKHAKRIYVQQMSREFRYTGAVDRRTLELFAFKINRAEDETRRNHSSNG